jgi:hypothetical protein
MATRTWIVLPGGRLKKWSASHTPGIWGGVPPRWYRNLLNRKERRRVNRAIQSRSAERHPYVNPREAPWYW